MLLAEIKLGKEKFKMDTILSTDISFENSYFYGRKREYKGNIRRIDELNYLLKSLEERGYLNFDALTKSSKNRTTDYGNIFKPKRPLAPVSLYFLAQLKGVDLEVFSNKELFALGVFADSVEHIFTPDKRTLFSHISRKREVIDYLSVSFSLHKKYLEALKNGVFPLKDNCRCFIVLYTYVYNLFFHHKQLGNIDVLCNLLLYLSSSKSYFSIASDNKDLANRQCSCKRCSQCVEEYTGKVFSTLGDLLGLDSFLMPTDSFKDNSTELSLLGDIYDFEVFYCNNSNEALSHHKEPSHKRNIWSYNNTYLSHENILEFMFTQTKKYVG